MPTYVFVLDTTTRQKMKSPLLYRFHLVKKFPAFHGTRRFITALTSVRHLTLYWTSPIQSIFPHPTSWRSIIILPSHLRLGLRRSPSLRFPQQDHIHPPLFTLRATWPAHPILLDFITRTILGEEYRSFSSSLCNLLYSPNKILYSKIIITPKYLSTFPNTNS